MENRFITRKDILYLFVIAFCGFITLFPSFNLALTGDDYLGLWRYNQFLSGAIGGNWNNISFLFTDYGPQDSITAVIHNYFGFSHRVYYVISFFLRYIAAISFIPLVTYTTKNRKIGYFSALLFIVTTIGLETTDWSFNMPSYIAITFLNIFLITYIKSITAPKITNIIFAGLLFITSIIAQPIRMTFLPPVILSAELIWLFLNPSKRTITYTFIKIFLFIFLTIGLLSFGHIGNSVGVGNNTGERSSSSFLNVINQYLAKPQQAITNNEYETFLYPIAQLGAIVLPISNVPQRFEIVTIGKAFTLVVLLSLGFSFVLAKFVSVQKEFNVLKPRKKILIFTVVSWSFTIWAIFLKYAEYPITLSQLVAFISGGYFLIFFISCISVYYKNKETLFIILLAFLIMIVSFSLPWLRDPKFLQISTSRYLIVPAAMCIVLLTTIAGNLKMKRAFFVFFLFPLLILNILFSYRYLHKLERVRSIEITDSIRRSIPKVPQFGTNEPAVFYFEPQNSQILHHALLFGFPVIMGAQYNFSHVWNVLYTDNWQEVVAAYENGTSLKRFSIPEQKVPLENIYSYKLIDKKLIDTSNDTRDKLQIIKIEAK